MSDIGKPKSLVASSFVMRRVPGVQVTAYRGKIQDLGVDFFRQFRVIIGGLDNMEARRWLNTTLCDLVATDAEGAIDPTTIIPFIDGGTEGFKGQARVIIPKVTACFECAIDMFPPPTTFALCTIAETPRRPEHCIAYAMMIEWDRSFGPEKRKIDKDSPVDMTWIYERALERAAKYGIEGVTYKLTMGVVKNIIPAIASTNALVSALCALEAFKIVSFAGQTLNNYHMFMGADGIHSSVLRLERKSATCAACADPVVVTVRMAPTDTLAQLIDTLKAREEEPRFANPAIGSLDRPLFFPRPDNLREMTTPNLARPLADLLTDGEEVVISDPLVEAAKGAWLRVCFA